LFLPLLKTGGSHLASAGVGLAGPATGGTGEGGAGESGVEGRETGAGDEGRERTCSELVLDVFVGVSPFSSSSCFAIMLVYHARIY
jgi:hypothetical protein